MKIEITVSASDLKTIHNLIPTMYENDFQKFMKDEFRKTMEKHGIAVEVKFGFSGIRFCLEGNIADIVTNFENDCEVDLKTIIQMYANAAMAFHNAVKNSFDIAGNVYKSRK